MKKFSGKNLRRIRGKKTIEDFILDLRLKGVRISYSSLVKYEQGMMVPGGNTIGKIASALGISTEDLYSELDDPKCVNA